MQHQNISTMIEQYFFILLLNFYISRCLIEELENERDTVGKDEMLRHKLKLINQQYSHFYGYELNNRSLCLNSSWIKEKPLTDILKEKHKHKSFNFICIISYTTHLIEVTFHKQKDFMNRHFIIQRQDI